MSSSLYSWCSERLLVTGNSIFIVTCNLSAQSLSQAIFMSGAIMTLPTPPTTSNDFLQVAAKELGCEQDGTHTDQDPSQSDHYDPTEIDRITKCLQSLPAPAFDIKYDLRFAINSISFGNDILPRPMAALVSEPEHLLQVGCCNRDYVLILTSDNGYVMVNSDKTRLDTSSAEKAERAAAATLLLFGWPEMSGKQILAPYRELYNGDGEKSISALFTDKLFISGTMGFVHLFTNPPAASDLGGAYLMSFEPGYIPSSTVLQSLELCYLFDLEPARILKSLYSAVNMKEEFSVEDIKVKEMFIDVMADFIKTGEPSSTLTRKYSITWLPAQRDSNRYLRFSARPTMKVDILQKQGLRRTDKLIKIRNKQVEKEPVTKLNYKTSYCYNLASGQEQVERLTIENGSI